MTKVSDIGERDLITLIMKQLTPMPGMPIPFWDDASALSIGDGRAIVINTDMLVWKTDIPKGMTPYQAARKAVIMNISDLAAKGVQPIAFLPSLAIPNDYPVKDVEELAKGFEAGAREYNAYVVGGDTNEACDIIISGTALGIIEENKIMKRDGGARPGDLLATTGLFGLTAAGFKILLEDYQASEEDREDILNSIYKPYARVKEGLALAETDAITSCMDSSDGLSVSLYDLKKSIKHGFHVTRLPVHPAASRFAEKHGLNSSDLALDGGEEYELVFTFSPENQGKIRDALECVGCELLVIGEVVEDDEVIMVIDGVKSVIRSGGWDHFKQA